MGRPETKRWVFPTTTVLLVLLFLLLMRQGHVLAATIFPLNSNSQLGTPQDSASSWDFDDSGIGASDDGEYSNFFSDNSMASEENDGSTSDPFHDWKVEPLRTSVYNSLESNYAVFPGKSSDEPTESFTLPQNQLHLAPGETFSRTRPLAMAALMNIHLRKPSTPNQQDNSQILPATAAMGHLDIKQSRFGREKMKTGSFSYTTNKVSSPSHDIHNSRHNGSVDNFDRNTVERYQESARFSSFNSRINMNTTDSKQGEAATMEKFSVNIAPLLINGAGKNQSEHGTDVSGRGSNTILQFKFPYRIPFTHVRRESNEDEKAGVKPQNINEESRPIDPSLRYAGGDMLVQRRIRSKRDTLEHDLVEEIKRVTGEEEDAVRTREESNILADQEIQEHQSSKKPSGSVSVGSIGEDKVGEINVRHNATSRPPPPSNAVEAFQRLTRLLDRMLKELSLFQQKFTLRLIRMTERRDIDQMQEIMKDFDISAEKPIFFIAGGLKKLNLSEARVVPPLLTIASNLTENATLVSNENAPTEPTTVINSTEQEQPVSTEVHDGTTMVPILRPQSEVSSLPVEPDANNEELEETTTVTPDVGSETAIPRETTNAPAHSFSISQVIHSSPARARRAVRDVDEFNFFPIPGRSARTENPYDDDEEALELFNNYEQASESVDGGGWYDENPDHLTSVSSGNPNSNILPPNYIPSEIGVIDQSQSQRNDEISSNDSDAIIGHSSGESGASTFTTALLTTQDVASLSSEEGGVSKLIGLRSTDSSLVPPNDSIKIETNQGSNDHHRHRQGEHNIPEEIQTKNTAAVSTVGENNISHVEEYLPNEKHLKSQVIIENADDMPYNFPSVSTDRIPSQIPNLANRKPISSFVDENQKADKRLNLAHETKPIEEHGKSKVVLDAGNTLEISKSPSSSLPLVLPLENAGGSLELLFDRQQNGNSEVVTPTLIPAELLQVGDRSFHSNSADDMGKQNVAQKLPLHDIILIKDGQRVESGNQQLLNSQLNAGTEVERDVSFSSLSNGVVSENEGIVIVPPTRITPAVEPISVTGIPSPVSHVPTLNEDIAVPVIAERDASLLRDPSSPSSIIVGGSSVVLDDINVNRDLEAPHRASVISKPQESNHAGPQVEIKAESPLPQASVLSLPESGINIPVAAAAAIKEILPTPNAEKMSLTSVEHVPVPHIPQPIPSKPATTSTKRINTIHVEETLPNYANMPMRPHSLPQSNVAPPHLPTEEASSFVASTRPIVTPLERESSENEEQTRNKQQSFTLGENQAGLVGEQSVVVVGNIMKKVVAGKGGDEIEREKAQVSPNQPTFHAPTVLKEIQIIANNNATFLPADKASPVPNNNDMPSQSTEHVVVRGAEILDLPDITLVQDEITDSIGDAVRNSGVVSVKNPEKSYASTATDEVGSGSIVVPIVSDNGEVRNPIATGISPVAETGNENDDILSKKFAGVSSGLVQPIMYQEPLNVGGVVLSPHEITIPLTESVGTTVFEDRLNTGSSSESVPLIVPFLPPVGSKDVDLRVQRYEDATHFQTQKVRNVPEVKAVIDPPKTVGDVIKPETVKGEAVPEIVTNLDISAIVPVDKKVVSVDAPLVVPYSEVVKVAPVDVGASSLKGSTTEGVTSITQILPDSLPTDTIIKVAPEEAKVVKVVSETPDVVIVKATPVEIPLKEAVSPQESVISDTIKPVVEIHNPEVVKVGPLDSIKLDATKVAEIVPVSESQPDSLQVPALEILAPPLTSTAEKVAPVTDKNNLVLASTPVRPNAISINPILKGTQQGEINPYAADVIKPIQEIVVEEKVPLIQPTGVKLSLNKPFDENIIASLPQVDPDSAFGVKPIVTQPHYQIPGLRPTVPDRPHPDYLGFLTQGVDADSLIFSVPTSPIIVSSPPVFSSYSPIEIRRKQEQMKKIYGLLARRALPI